MTLTQEEIATLDRGLNDPVWWVENVLGLKPWSVQADILRSVMTKRRTVVKSCHAIGKSTIAAAATLNFVSNRPGAIAITTATSDRQVRGILWRELRQMWAGSKFPLGGRMTETRWVLGKVGNWWAWGFTAPEYDPTRFQGFHAPHVLVVIDEAAGVSGNIYEGLDSAMASGNAHSLEIGNPTNENGPFGHAFRDGEASCFSVSAFETPNFTAFGITIDDIRDDSWREKVTGPLPYPYLIGPEWVREKWVTWTRRGMDEEDPRWMARVLARFPTAGDRALIPMWWVDLAFERWTERTDAERNEPKPRPGFEKPKVGRIGVDVARDGPDNTERAFYENIWGVRWLKTAPKQNTMATAGTVLDDLRLMEKQGYTVKEVRTDADGLGAGVHDRLCEKLKKRAVEIRSGMKARDPTHFLNRRGEMLWDLREALDPQNLEAIALPPDPELARQIASIQWEMDGNGRRVIEPKKETTRRLGCSPDKCDAVAYAVANTEYQSKVPSQLDSGAFESDNPFDV